MRGDLFNNIILLVFSNGVLHGVLSVSEYVFVILPSSLSVLYSYKDADFINDNLFSSFSILNILLTKVDLIFHALVLLITIVLSLSFIALTIVAINTSYFNNQSKSKTIFFSIILNLFDNFLFRYFCFIPYNTFWYFLAKFFLGDNFLNYFLGYFLFIFYGLYLLINFYYINLYALLLRIQNKNIVMFFPSYPYLKRSTLYEILMILLKNIFCFHYNFSEAKSQKVYLLCTNFAAILCFAFIFISFCYTLFHNFFFKFNKKNIKDFSYLVTYSLNFFFTFSLLFSSVITKKRIIISLIFSALCVVLLIIILNESNSLINRNESDIEYILSFITENSQLEKSKRLNFVKLLESINLKHTKNKDACHCKICEFWITHDKNDFSQESEQLSNIVSNFYKIIKVIASETIENTKHYLTRFYSEIITLFEYRINNEIYLYFYHLSSLVYKYRKYQNICFNLNLLTKISYSQTKNPVELLSSKVEIFNQVLKISSINRQLTKNLKSLKNFIENDSVIDNFDVVIPLASSFHKLRKEIYFQVIHPKKENDVDGIDSRIISTLDNSNKYALTLFRFIIEDLFHKPFSNVSPLYLDQLEDNLNYNFENDRSMILEAYYLNRKCLVDIVKLPGICKESDSERRNFFKFIYEDYQGELRDKFIEILSQYQTSYGGKQSKICEFQFIYKKKNYLSYLNYHFKLVPVLTTSHILLCGYVTTTNSGLLLLNKELKILGIDKRIGKLLGITNNFFEYLKGSSSMSANSFFLNLSRKVFQEKQKCTIDFEKFKEEFQRVVDFASNKKSTPAASKEKTGKSAQSVTVIIEKTLKITDSVSLFKVSRKDFFQKEDDFDINTVDYNERRASILYFGIGKETTTALDSMISNSTLGSSRLTDKKLRRTLKSTKQERDKERKNIKIFQIIINFLSLGLILLCTFFFVVQFRMTNEMSKVNDIITKYKTMQISFSSGMLSLMSTICYSKVLLDGLTCESFFEKLNLHFSSIIPKDHYYQEYIAVELKQKSKYLQESLSKVKERLHKEKDKNVSAILSFKMNYTSIEKNDFKLYGTESQISFEEGLRIHFNTFSVAITENYSRIDIGIIPTKYGEKEERIIDYGFIQSFYDSLEDITFNHLIMYRIIVNYSNFLANFREGESILSKFFFDLRSKNFVFCIIFMLLNFIVHFLLFFVSSLSSISIFNLIFQVFMRMKLLLENEGFKNHLLEKLENYAILSLLYHKNPNKVILQMKDEMKKYNLFSSAQKKDTTTEEETVDLKKESNINVSRKAFFNKFFSFYVSVIKVLYLFTFSVLIALDIYLVVIFKEVFETHKYTILAYNLEIHSYNSLILPHMTRMLNLTRTDYNKLYYFIFKTDSSEEDSMDTYISETQDILNNIKQLRKNSPNKFHSLNDLFGETDCETFVKKLNDPFLTSIDEQLNKSYTQVAINTCKSFNCIMLKDFSYTYHQIFLNSHLINNKVTVVKSFLILKNYIKEFTVFKLYIIELFFLRPLGKANINMLITPKMKSDFHSFFVYIVAYLVTNFVLAFMILGLMRSLNLRNLRDLQSNVLLLNKFFVKK